jgi:hypothetical protein
MTESRHRRDASRRTVAIGAALATAMGLGVLALGLAQGPLLRLALILVLAVAIGAAVLAMDEARLTEARVRSELSRERASRSRDTVAAQMQIAKLLARIDGLESDLAALRSTLLAAPRTTVVVAPTHVARPRVIEIPDAVPAAEADADLDLDPVSERIVLRRAGTDAAPERVVDVTAVAPAAHGYGVVEASDEPLSVEADDFPVVEVVGEFSLEGLAVFPRPAGMPESFPSITDDDRVIDLRERQRTERTA